jgi:hypothetical protein
MTERTIEILDRLIGRAIAMGFRHKEARFLSVIARHLRVVESWSLADLMDDAVDEGRLSEADRSVISRVDVVLTGRRRKDGQDVYFVVEATADIDVHDVERIATCAALLAKLGRPVVPVVTGRRIEQEAASLAQVRGAWTILGDELTPPRGN